MTAALQEKKAHQVSAYSEFLKALDIIDKTQLTLFIDHEPADQAQQLRLYESRMQELDASLNLDTASYSTERAAKQIEIMRSIIAQTINQYNDKYANYINPESLKKYSIFLWLLGRCWVVQWMVKISSQGINWLK